MQIKTTEQAAAEARQAAYLMDGFIGGSKMGPPLDDDELLSNNGGQVGIVADLVGYAPAVVLFAKVAAKLHDPEHGDYPGVLEYEVTSDFGLWYRTFCCRRRCLPAELEGHLALASLMAGFFGRRDPALANRISAALCGLIRNDFKEVSHDPT